MSSRTAPDFLGRAREGWGETLPDWIIALAEACQATSQTAAAKRLGVSGSQISQVLANCYPSPLDRLEEMVRGALMGGRVQCKELGEIGRDKCLAAQALQFSSASPSRVRLYRACRAGCPHSRIKG